jgi:hypothetical protein
MFQQYVVRTQPVYIFDLGTFIMKLYVQMCVYACMGDSCMKQSSEDELDGFRM